MRIVVSLPFVLLLWSTGVGAQHPFSMGGAYDAAINGWVLMPHDVSGLAILPPADLREDFTVTLLGVALRPCEANAVRVLARLPVTLA